MSSIKSHDLILFPGCLNPIGPLWLGFEGYQISLGCGWISEERGWQQTWGSGKSVVQCWQILWQTLTVASPLPNAIFFAQVLMRALRDFNLPKIVTSDVPIFLGLISDLFPQLDVPRKRDPELEAAVRQSVAELHLQPEENFILKVTSFWKKLLASQLPVLVRCNALSTWSVKVFVSLQVTQLEELLAVRHSVFIVGGPGTGKSQVSFSTTIVSLFTAQQ